MPSDETQSGNAAWSNVNGCMCSAKIDAKGATLDKSACPIHGKSKAKS